MSSGAAARAGDWDLLSAWRRLAPVDLRPLIAQACTFSHKLLASPDGTIDDPVPINRILSSMAMRRYTGTRLMDAGWTVVADAALQGDRRCQTLVSMELSCDPVLAAQWLALRPKPPLAKKVNLRARQFLRRRSRTKP